MNNIYNVYLTFGTIPSLYAQMNAYIDSNPSVIFARSDGYFDKSKNPDNLIQYHKFVGYDNDFLNNDYQLVVDALHDIKSKNKNARFVVYIDDSRVQFLLKPFLLANCYEDIDKIVMISEGNITEYMFSDIKSGDYDYQKQRWKILIDKIQNQDEDSNQALAVISNYCYYLSTLGKNVLLLPYSNLLENKNVPVKYREKMHFEMLDLYTMFNSVDGNLFLGKEARSFHFKDNSIVIIGTYNFYDSSFSKFLYENLINQVLMDYSDYNFYFKAHPLYPVSDNPLFEDFLTSRNIEVIPEKLPLEILLYKNKNVFIGGFCSSIHSLIPLNRIKFVFGEFIGFSRLLKKNHLLDVKAYNLEVSQKFASELTRIYFEREKLVGALNEQLNILNNKVDDLVEQNKSLTKTIEKLGVKNMVRRVKDKIVRRKL